MDRITHQSPRQQGYRSTPSPRNDSLKHTRKHERRKESNQRTKLSASGGLSGQAGRTVRSSHADRPPAAVDCPKPLPTKTRNQNGSKAKPSKNMKNTGRTRSLWTVRRSLADCLRLTDRPENSPTSKVNSPKSSSDFPKGRSCGVKGLGT
jgi:hypothetical protein